MTVRNNDHDSEKAKSQLLHDRDEKANACPRWDKRIAAHQQMDDTDERSRHREKSRANRKEGGKERIPGVRNKQRTRKSLKFCNFLFTPFRSVHSISFCCCLSSFLVCIGIFLPLLSNFLPIRRALSSTLRDSLDLYHHVVSTVTVRVMKVTRRGQDEGKEDEEKDGRRWGSDNLFINLIFGSFQFFCLLLLLPFCSLSVLLFSSFERMELNSSLQHTRQCTQNTITVFTFENTDESPTRRSFLLFFSLCYCGRVLCRSYLSAQCLTFRNLVLSLIVYHGLSLASHPAICLFYGLLRARILQERVKKDWCHRQSLAESRDSFLCDVCLYLSSFPFHSLCFGSLPWYFHFHFLLSSSLLSLSCLNWDWICGNRPSRSHFLPWGSWRSI